MSMQNLMFYEVEICWGTASTSVASGCPTSPSPRRWTGSAPDGR